MKAVGQIIYPFIPCCLFSEFAWKFASHSIVQRSPAPSPLDSPNKALQDCEELMLNSVKVVWRKAIPDQSPFVTGNYSKYGLFAPEDRCKHFERVPKLRTGPALRWCLKEKQTGNHYFQVLPIYETHSSCEVSKRDQEGQVDVLLLILQKVGLLALLSDHLRSGQETFSKRQSGRRQEYPLIVMHPICMGAPYGCPNCVAVFPSGTQSICRWTLLRHSLAEQFSIVEAGQASRSGIGCQSTPCKNSAVGLLP